MNLERLFRPKTVAVYGGKWSDYVVEQCIKLGFKGIIWRVHPTRQDCFHSSEELPEAPDAVFLGINRELTVKEFSTLRQRGSGGAVVFASGFSEEKDGAAYARKLETAAGKLPFIGPNCYGFANFFDRVALWPDQVTGTQLERGVAFIAQSGTISISIMSQRRSLPLGYVISLGNQQRLAAEDLIRYCAEDERVSAIGLYLEGILDLPKFIDAVDYARTLGKPIALIKAGSSEKGRNAANTHTGALTGSDKLHDALFERLGIARCETLSSLVETLKLLHCFGPLPSKRILVFGASGGDMAMVSDSASKLDLDFSQIPETETDVLRASVGERVKLNNPLDIQTATWFDYSKLEQMFAALLRCDYAVTAFMVDPQDETEADTEAFDLAIDTFLETVNENSASGNAALLSSLPESLSKATREKCLRAGVAPMQGLAESLEALQHAAKISKAWNEWSKPEIFPPLPDLPSISTLSEADSKELLAQHGFEIPKKRIVAADQILVATEEIGFPVVLKAVVPDLAHKTEHGGVALNLHNIPEVVAAATAMSGLAETFLVEEMITDGVAEMILGVSVDPQFGANLTLAAGGIFTELLKDSVALLFPVSEKQVRKALQNLRIYAVLKGWRGKPVGATEALIKAVLKLAKFTEHHAEQLAACEINPLIVRPKGKGVIVVDALICWRAGNLQSKAT
ncbi:MAG: acetate--CoA ligase family protein [SAR324 cluster bacterium]|nr:acetate--CoA ligase family protein [SAR324 cluster bacterium]